MKNTYIILTVKRTITVLVILLSYQILNTKNCIADSRRLLASYYSENSLRREGTWKTSKGVMANGKQFDEKKFTCATRLYPLGSTLRISNKRTGRSVVCKVSDRIGKRFATTRIDLSKAAFQQIAKLEEGLVEVEVTR